MAEGAVNRVWVSMDLGNFTVGRKVSVFAGGDTFAEVHQHLSDMFGVMAADQIIGHLGQLGTEEAFDNLKSGGVVGGGSTPAGAAADPAGPVCNHGARKYVTSKPGAAKSWKAWMCPADKDDPTKCSPEWA